MSGARRQENRWDPKENEQVVPETKEVSRRLYDDAMYKLEHGAEDTKTARSRDSALDSAIALSEAQWGDDYASNSALRASFRVCLIKLYAKLSPAKMNLKTALFQARKKELQRAKISDQALLKKTSLSIDLVKEHEDDVKLARLLVQNKKGINLLNIFLNHAKWRAHLSGFFVAFYSLYHFCNMQILNISQRQKNRRLCH